MDTMWTLNFYAWLTNALNRSKAIRTEIAGGYSFELNDHTLQVFQPAAVGPIDGPERLDIAIVHNDQRDDVGLPLISLPFDAHEDTLFSELRQNPALADSLQAALAEFPADSGAIPTKKAVRLLHEVVRTFLEDPTS